MLLQTPLPKSVAALKVARTQATKPEWVEKWKASPRHVKMSHIDPSMPSSKTSRTLTNLPQHTTSILTQLRTGHVALCLFLKKIKAANLALCPHCLKPESVPHYLLYCKKFTGACCQLRFRVGKAATSLSKLLSSEKVIPHTLRYIARSKRFENYVDFADHG